MTAFLGAQTKQGTNWLVFAVIGLAVLVARGQTFGDPVLGFDEQFFTLVQAKNAVEVQCMADQAIFLDKPAHACYLSGITYS